MSQQTESFVAYDITESAISWNSWEDLSSEFEALINEIITYDANKRFDRDTLTSMTIAELESAIELIKQ
jgi:hypothetical protein